jgi:hypothetical protein
VFETDTTAAARQLVRAGLAAASRQRRISETSRQFWRAAPVVAALSLGLAVISLWAGWAAILGAGVLVAGFAGLTAYTVVRRRDQTVTDPVAARVDADAGLAGELRSAAWFAAHDAHDVWTDFHLDRAAARLGAVDWVARYPPVRAPRAKLATSVMVVAALGLSIAMTYRDRVRSEALTAKTLQDPKRDRLVVPGQPLPPELQKLLAELLAAAESGNASAEARLAASAELRELLAQLGELRDAAALKELARTLASEGLSPDRASAAMTSLAERTKRAAEMASMPPEVRKALEEFSNTLSELAAAEQAAGKDSASSETAQAGEAAEGQAGADAENAAIVSMKDADAGSGVVMMADQDGSMGGDPGSGAGGGSAAEGGGGTMPDLALALRKETVEANADAPGENILTNTRRKTEHGRATVTYTQAAPGTLDRSRAAAPPPVPEGRRSAVQTYFIRKP